MSVHKALNMSGLRGPYSFHIITQGKARRCWSFLRACGLPGGRNLFFFFGPYSAFCLGLIHNLMSYLCWNQVIMIELHVVGAPGPRN
jgi:hypothetical protein